MEAKLDLIEEAITCSIHRRAITRNPRTAPERTRIRKRPRAVREDVAFIPFLSIVITARTQIITAAIQGALRRDTAVQLRAAFGTNSAV